MNKKFTKLIAALALLVFMTPSLAGWGQTRTEVTWTASAQGYSNEEEVTDITINSDISGAFAKGTGSNAPKYYNTGTAVRMYGSNTLSITASDALLTKIEFTYHSTYNSKDYTVNTGEYTQSTGVWTGSAASVIFTAASGSGHNRIQAIKVTYTISGGGPTQLAAPTNFQATAGNGQAAFTWDAVTNASSYTISYTPAGGTEQTASGITGTSHTITGLTNSTAYTCKIKAVGDDTSYTDSYYSSPITVTPTAPVIYTVTLDPGNGSVASTTWNVTMNNGNLPDATPLCNTWSFGGWSTTAVASQTTTAPTYVPTAYVPTSDITLYAVYTKTEGGGNTDGTVTLASGVYNSSTPATITWTEDYITILQEKGTSSNAVSNSYISNPRWYQNHVITMTPTSTVNSITITQYDGKYGLEDSGTLITNGSASVDNHVVTITPTNGNQAVVITMGAQARINAISVNYVGSTTYYHSNPDCTETVAMPTFDVNEGTYYEPQIIIIECETADASIYYTLNGEEPTSTESATNFLYDENEGVEISSTTTLKAKAFKTGMNPSATRTATYTIIHDVAEPTLAESQLFTTDTYSVAITVPANTTVYYTIDGTAPTNASTQYTNAFDINSTTTVKAIAYDGDGCASDVVSATYTRAYTLAGAKALYVDQNVPNITISLTGVQFIAKSGSSTYMQQDNTGLMIYGSHSQDLTNGDVFTAGTVTGTITKYGENLELSISSGAFANVAKTAGTLAASATDVEITDITDDFSTYESRYVALESLEMSVTDKTLSDGTNTLAIYDPFYVLDEAIQPDDDVIVTGVVTSYYKNSNTTYQIIPLAKSGITTGIAATLPTLTPAGGADAAHAVSTETVIVTPATSTTVTYSFGTSVYGEIDGETEITVPSTEATELEVVASRDFYTDNSASYYYMSAAASYTVNFYENGTLTYYEDNVVSGTSLAISSTTAPNGYEFMGWTTAAISGVQAGAPAILYNGSVTVDDNMDLYAVYAMEGEASVSYNKVDGYSSITEGTYLIAVNKVDSDNYNFANGQAASGHAGVEATGVATATSYTASDIPEGALEYTLAGNNTDGFSIHCSSGYLNATSAKTSLSYGNTVTETWIFSNKDGGLVLKGANNSSKASCNSTTAASAIRNYASTGSYYDPLYFFKKAETPTYSNYCTTVTILSGDISGTKTGANSIDASLGATIKTGTILTATVLGNADPNALEIEDGAQLITDSKGVKATVVKHINKYDGDKDNYYLLASPIKGEVAATNVTNMLDNSYDLYYFDQDQEGEEWRNYEASTFAIANGNGYLYANSANVDLEFSGELVPSNEGVTIPLAYTEQDGPVFNGWNLVGNPFACNASSSITNFYHINGSVLEATSGVVSACEGIFVQATAANENITFTKAVASGANNNGGILNINLMQANNSRSCNNRIDLARIRFGQGNELEKLEFFANDAKVYIQQDNKDYAVVYAEAQGEMPVNFKASKNGTYTISVNVENMEMNYLHLIDNMTGADVDLLATPSYSFEAKTTDYASRFRLVFSANDENGASTGSATFAYYNGSEWVISNMGDATLQVVDVMGRVLSTETVNGNATMNLNQTPGVYMLRLVNGDSVKVQKVVVR